MSKLRGSVHLWLGPISVFIAIREGLLLDPLADQGLALCQRPTLGTREMIRLIAVKLRHLQHKFKQLLVLVQFHYLVFRHRVFSCINDCFVLVATATAQAHPHSPTIHAFRCGPGLPNRHNWNIGYLPDNDTPRPNRYELKAH